MSQAVELDYFGNLVGEKAREDIRRTKDYAIDSSLSAIIISNLESKITYSNNAASMLWNDAIQDKNISNLFSDMVIIKDMIHKTISEGSWMGELSISAEYIKDGEPTTLQVLSDLVTDEAGKSIAIMFSCNDVSQRKKSEAELFEAQRQLIKEQTYIKNIIYSLSDMLLITDLGGTILDIGGTTATTLGRESELCGKKINQVLGINSDDFINFAHKAKIRNILDYEHIFKTKNKGVIEANISCTTISDINKKPEQLVFLIRDQTDSRLVNELRTTQSQLVESAKLASLGELSAGLAHELNNPLFFIDGFAENLRESINRLILGESVDLKEVGEDLSEILIGVEKMKKIINHFRSFSRQDPQNFLEIDIRDVINRSFLLTQEQIRLQKIGLVKQIDNPVPSIAADANRLEQVIINLLNNARDSLADQSDPKKIEVTTDINNSHVTLTISDNGMGIKKDDLERIFNPFFTTKPVGKGTGLGLSISHQIIKEHGGTIICNSELGVGTTFKITLPTWEQHCKKEKGNL